MAESIKPSAFVVDASFVLAALLSDENAAVVDEMFDKFALNQIVFISTYLLKYEVINGLKMAIIRSRTKPPEVRKLTKLFLGWGIKYERVNFEELLDMALKKEITVYDASYLWLAKSKKLPLLSLDKKLIALAKNRN